jgi:hypothetical protein
MREEDRSMSEERPARFAKLSDDIVYAVCDLFFAANLRASDIADTISARKDAAGKLPFRITRESIYPILVEGRARGFFELRAPLERSLAQSVEDTFTVRIPSLAKVPPIQVVDFVDVADRRQAAIEVVNRAAGAALALIREIASRKKKEEPVHVGFASGWTTRLVARKLAEEITRDRKDIPPLVLHATSSGFDERQPVTASTTFFSLFEKVPVPTSFVGMFAPTFVESRKYEAAKKTPGARNAFKERDKIDLLISALASMDDQDSELQRFIAFLAEEQRQTRKESKQRHSRPTREEDDLVEDFEFPSAEEFRAALQAAGWVGDVNLRPFSRSRAIDKQDGIKCIPLTLFDLPRMTRRAKQENKAMLLVAGPCGICGKPRSEALYWLMRNKDLKVWTHIVMDRVTAETLLDIDRKERGRKNGNV